MRQMLSARATFSNGNPAFFDYISNEDDAYMKLMMKAVDEHGSGMCDAPMLSISGPLTNSGNALACISYDVLLKCDFWPRGCIEFLP